MHSIKYSKDGITQVYDYANKNVLQWTFQFIGL